MPSSRGRISRREFVKTAALAFPALASRRSGEKTFLSGIGVCSSLSNDSVLSAAGCDYIEEGVRNLLVPEEPEDRFLSLLAASKKARLRVPACNGFLPGRLKAVGPEAKSADILAYARTAFDRAARAGVRTIVWGSGESRKIPEGWLKTNAEEQFRALAVHTAGLAAEFGVVLALEPLQSSETNFINNLGEGAAMVEAVGHPSFRLLADIFHMMREGETPESIERFGRLLRHCHIAEKENRTAPGIAGDDFRPYLRALRKAGYAGGLSLECRWDNLAGQAAAALDYLRKQVAEVSR
jgi:sugar phosphate isomerase/epimerase